MCKKDKMKIEILIKRKQNEQATRKAKWLMMKSEYVDEYEKADSSGITRAIILIQKCEYQISLCDEWLDFLNKIQKQI